MLYQFIYSFFQTIVKLITVTEEKLNVFLGKLFGPIVFVYDIFRDEINYSIKAAMVLCTDENVKQISFFFCNIYLFLFFFPENFNFWKQGRSINTSILEHVDTILTRALLFGYVSLDDTSNTLILNATIGYLISPKTLDASLFAHKLNIRT